MNGIIKQIEKHQELFQRISANIYLTAIKDGFLTAMPVILFSSLFILCAAIPPLVGIKLPESFETWLWKIYDYSMGIVGLLVAGTTARCLAGSMNRKMPSGKVINEVSVMLASIVSFLLLAVTKMDGAFQGDFFGTKGILSSFVAAFITVNVYKFCVIKDITIKMPKEVPGSISQNFRDVFPFSFSVFFAAIIDIATRYYLNVPFAEVFSKILSPVFQGAETYLGLSIIWFLVPFFWFVGVHGPSVVKPGLAAALYGNTEANLELFRNGQHPFHALTENFGNFVGELGGTGATFIVPIIFILFMKSKQLKAVGKASIVPVMFAVNEPLLFAAPIVLNPYFLIPFCLAPIVNVILGKFFISVLGMNGYMHVLPWATPGPIGNLMSTHFQPISFVFTVLLLVVDFIIYYPFCKAYDKVLLSEETKNANTEDRFETNNSTKVDESETVQLEKEIKILVLCAGAGTSAMLANALTEGASSLNLPLSSSAGAYGSHYEIMKYYDMVILAPQVKTYYNDIKKDTEKLGIKLIATEGAEYINLTRNPEKAVQFVLEKLN
ncbi:PTS system, lactose-specific IIBC component [Streptococcus pneumoniae]|uniref:PTS system lactose-specific EIICB component n=14 Tax=Streptococcus pneumoniae TaxID=1313 RepID=A0A0T8LJU6_STREE|nr:PTS lactose transporter subunit IIBC [Streptococcus pneumoniae]OYL00100.1 PTS lactose transporter subunit IIBC [Streptococcus pneumoniae E709]OYL01557.1 PTS lactose transporter subunit IIBC [Streptococcus pneumoniae K2521]ANO36978.1 PTS system, lactose-specific IIB or IIC component [Streptococcus pneumoniae]AOG58180.1 PTS system, lactose-specific IIB or IIC component [Streptococcus pneumoniae]EHZ58329.1 PTS system lactose-specific EIICB component [Streptococcus pneumoniae GA47210]